MSVDKIAFLFVVDTDPQFPRVWDRYFAGNEDKVSVYVCARRPAEARWRRAALVASDGAPDDAVSAYMCLFRAAFADPANLKFITASEACLPMRPFAEMYEYLTASPDSLVMRLTALYSDFDPADIDAVMVAVGECNIIKHHAQMALSRAHVRKLVGTSTVDAFRAMALGSEYFLSSIAPMRNVLQFEITHDDRRYIEGRMQTVKEDIQMLSLAMRSPEGRGRSADILAARDTIAGDLADLRCKYADLAHVPEGAGDAPDAAADGRAAALRGAESFFYRRFDEHANIDAYIYAFLKAPERAAR